MPLAEFFAQCYLELYFENTTFEIAFSNKLQSRLKTYNWAGNVRELENIVESWIKKTISNRTSDSLKVILSEKLFDEYPPFLADYRPTGNQQGFYYSQPNSLKEFDSNPLPAFQMQALTNLKSKAPKNEKRIIQKRIERLKANFSENVNNPEIGPIATNSGPALKHQQNPKGCSTPIRTST